MAPAPGRGSPWYRTYREAVTVPVAFILKGYPRLSETFIAQEIRALERRGLDLRLVSLRHPTDPTVHPVHREIAAPVTYLPEYLHDEPFRVLRAWAAMRRRPGYDRARAVWRQDFRRDRTRSRRRRFGQALVLAHELPADVGWLHAHFLHTPASVTRYAALLLDLPWSVSAHAKDVWTIPDWEKREKLADCRWLTTCTTVNADHLARLAPAPERVHRIYHGLDLARFPAPPPRPAYDGRDPAQPVRILSVGRAVEKKGYDDLLAALAMLPDHLHWRLTHIGRGGLLDALRHQAHTLGLDERVTWRGALPHEAVLDAYRNADLFVLASRIAADGDRDGLPNVLMEAMTQGLPCLSTRVSAIPELISDGVNGALVPPGDRAALSADLARLIGAPDERARLGAAGAATVRRRFAMDAGIDRLAALFGLAADEPPETAACALSSMPL